MVLDVLLQCVVPGFRACCKVVDASVIQESILRCIAVFRLIERAKLEDESREVEPDPICRRAASRFQSRTENGWYIIPIHPVFAFP